MLDEARALVLGANPIAYGAFTGSAERGVYELILKYKALAQAMTGDVQACSDTYEEAIRSIEAQRYLVNSPERQSAFLDWRADFYRFGVAAARKLGNWDQMLYSATHGTSVFRATHWIILWNPGSFFTTVG